jgi:monoamine oxidase
MQFTRRAALLGLGAGAAAFSTRSFSAPPAEPDVVVIGAGSAGIAAAQTLMAAGRSVVVLEAMGRIGGRAWTDTTSFGQPFDQGCAWLHKSDHNPYTAYARANGFEVRPHEYDLEVVYYGKTRGAPADARRVNAIEEKMGEQITAFPRDVASSRVVAVSTPAQEAASDYLAQLDFAVDLDELSSFDYGKADDLEPNLLCRQGFGSIVARRGQGLPVRLGTPARRIRYGGKGVTVETDAGDIRARACVVTASTGALASGVLRFDPEPPVAWQEALADVPMGMLAKIPLRTPGERFGLKPFDDVMVERHGQQDIYFLSYPFDTDLMIGFVGGDFGWELSAAGPDAAVDFAKAALADMFGSKAPAKVDKGLLTGWASNPWTRGAYAAARPGRYSARAVLARPFADRVFFAGEALAEGLIQTCGGAFNSGTKTARMVHASLGAA